MLLDYVVMPNEQLSATCSRTESNARVAFCCILSLCNIDAV